MKYTFPPRKILVPTDLSATSLPALEFARVLHNQFGGAVRLMHAQHFDLPPYFSGGQLQKLTRELQQSARKAADYLRKEGIALLGFDAEVSVTDKHPVEAILEASIEQDIDLIVMGSHGRHGADRFWLGSVAERILHETARPVLAVRQGMLAAPFRHVLCPVGLSGVGRGALEYAATIAAAGRLQLTVLHSVEQGETAPVCSFVSDEVRGRCHVAELTYHGDAANSILTAAREAKPDVIVMGAERKPSIFGELFSTTTARILQWGEAPLLVVPAAPRAEQSVP